MVNSLNLILPAPAPLVAEPMVVGFSTPKLKSLISKAFVFAKSTSVVSPSMGKVGDTDSNQMKASTAAWACETIKHIARKIAARRWDLSENSALQLCLADVFIEGGDSAGFLNSFDQSLLRVRNRPRFQQLALRTTRRG